MILVIGKNSFLGRALLRCPEAGDIRFIGHEDIDRPGVFDGIDCVINVAIDPRYKAEPYDAEFDFDLRVARMVAGKKIRYIMPSSRKVYSPEIEGPIQEDSPTAGIGEYGKNKLRTERELESCFGDRLTRLRISNVIGFDPQWGRKTFMAAMMSTLKKDNRITLDISPQVRRDFITDDATAQAMIRVAELGLTGVYNLGSGIGLPVDQPGKWLIEGYGQGRIEVIDHTHRDEFVLNVNKLSEHLGTLCSRDSIRETCLEAGRKLKDIKI